MILADTSIWIEHLRGRSARLPEMLERQLILIHPAVVGELACGNLRNRAGLLRDLDSLPRVRTATDEEALHLIAFRRLWGRGLGWIDVQLLASALLTPCALWTGDSRLAQAARDAGVHLWE